VRKTMFEQDELAFCHATRLLQKATSCNVSLRSNRSLDDSVAWQSHLNPRAATITAHLAKIGFRQGPASARDRRATPARPRSAAAARGWVDRGGSPCACVFDGPARSVPVMASVGEPASPSPLLGKPARVASPTGDGRATRAAATALGLRSGPGGT